MYNMYNVKATIVTSIINVWLTRHTLYGVKLYRQILVTIVIAYYCVHSIVPIYRL